MIGASLQGQRCLLVLPLSFYSFGDTLRQELQSRGMEVALVNDEFPANIFGKILGKLKALKLLRQRTLRHFQNQYADSAPYDLVLIIKGRGVSSELVSFFKSISKRVIGYNFDSFLFNPSPLDWHKDLDRYCTFDIKDAREHGLPLVHLFSALPTDMEPGEKTIDVSVIMKNHSQRLVYIDQVLSHLPDLSRSIYILEPNFISFIFGVLRHPRLYLKYRRDIHFKPLGYSDFLNRLNRSHVTIDYAHPSQTGITIRCFEARSLGTAIVTNNKDTLTNPLFDPDTTAVFRLDGDREKMAADIRHLIEHKTSTEIRSVADFISELLELDPLMLGFKHEMKQ